jgi:hypothetical protein
MNLQTSEQGSRFAGPAVGSGSDARSPAPATEEQSGWTGCRDSVEVVDDQRGGEVGLVVGERVRAVGDDMQDAVRQRPR